ncbi:MAG: hypothetical protein Q8P40_15165, partial [Nitrospirota bacterium]|nr:hypothetical protein [Nitrospirota bacterium]
ALPAELQPHIVIEVPGNDNPPDTLVQIPSAVLHVKRFLEEKPCHFSCQGPVSLLKSERFSSMAITIWKLKAFQ